MGDPSNDGILEMWTDGKDETPRLQQPILGVTPCCWPRDLRLLLQGVLYGWIVLFRRREGRFAVRWLYWKCWYWPGYVMSGYQRDVPCRHNTIARQRRLPNDH